MAPRKGLTFALIQEAFKSVESSLKSDVKIELLSITGEWCYVYEQTNLDTTAFDARQLRDILLLQTSTSAETTTWTTVLTAARARTQKVGTPVSASPVTWTRAACTTCCLGGSAMCQRRPHRRRPYRKRRRRCPRRRRMTFGIRFKLLQSLSSRVPCESLWVSGRSSFKIK